MFNAIRNLFTNETPATPARREGTARPSLESLEERECLSWTAVPATYYWPSSTTLSFTSNERHGTTTISNNEVDRYNFVAPRSGTYPFTAGKNGSRVDTLMGLFKFNGSRVA